MAIIKSSIIFTSMFFFFFFFLVIFKGCTVVAWEDPCENLASGKKGGLKHGRGAICMACNYTTYRGLCAGSLLGYHGSKSASPTKLTWVALRVAMKSAMQAYGLARTLLLSSDRQSNIEREAIEDCMELMCDCRDELWNSSVLISKLRGSPSDIHGQIQDALVFTSAALTYQSTCSDGLTSTINTKSNTSATGGNTSINSTSISGGTVKSGGNSCIRSKIIVGGNTNINSTSISGGTVKSGGGGNSCIRTHIIVGGKSSSSSSIKSGRRSSIHSRYSSIKRSNSSTMSNGSVGSSASASGGGGDGGDDDGPASAMQLALDNAGQMVTIALSLVAHLETHLCSWQTPDPFLFPTCKKHRKYQA